MKAFILALGLVLMLVVPVGATFDPGAVIQNGKPLQKEDQSCRGVPVTQVLISMDEKFYVLFVAKNMRAILVEFDAGGRMTEGVFGTVDKGLNFKVEKRLSAEEIQQLYPSPCDFLAEVRA